MQSLVTSPSLLDSGGGRESAPSQEPDSSTIDQSRLAQPTLFLAGTLAPQNNFDDPSLLASSSWPLLTAAGCSSTTSGLLQTTSPNNNNNNSSTRKGDRNQSNMPAASSSTSLLDATAPYGPTSSYYNAAAAAAATYPAYSAMYSANAAPAAAAAYYQQMASSGALRNPSTAAAASLQYALGSTAAAAASAPYYGSLLSSSAAGTNYDYTAAYGANYYGGFKSYPYGLNSAYQSLSSTLDASALSSFAPKGDGKKSKSSKKKKVGGSASPPEAQYVRVFVWDLDDVSVMAPSQLEMAQRLAPAASQPHVLRQAAHQVSLLAFPSSTDNHLDINDHEFFQVCNADDAVVEEPSATAAAPATTTPAAGGEGGGEEGSAVTSTTTTRSVTSEAARRVAAKYAHLRQVYGEYAINRGNLLDLCRPAASKDFEESLATVDAMLGGRTQNVLRCLEIVTARSNQSMDKYANVIISNESVVAQAAQMLLIGAAPYVPLENLFSCGKQGKEMILERLAARFGKKCSFVVVSSSGETQSIARKEQMAAWPVTSADSFHALYAAQSDYLLGSGR